MSSLLVDHSLPPNVSRRWLNPKGNSGPGFSSTERRRLIFPGWWEAMPPRPARGSRNVATRYCGAMTLSQAR